MVAQAAQRLDEALVPVANKVDSRTASEIPTDGMTELLRQEFEKGTRVGILMMKDFPRAQVEFLEEQIRGIRDIMDEENENG